MSRVNRQLKILDIISKHDIDTQEELVAQLRREGYDVTQATISRDIKDMGIVKTLASDGKHYKYSVQQSKESNAADKYLSMFKNAIVSIQCAGNLIVIKTEEASAGPAAQFIDNLHFEEILGVVAGENTIFVAIDDSAHGELVRDRLLNLTDVTEVTNF